MRFGLIANLRREGAREAIDCVLEWAGHNSHEVFHCREELEEICHNRATNLAREELATKVDILISMGGDGTFLATARSVGSSGTPVLGINLGSLGFLTQLRPHQLENALNAIVRGEYLIEERMLLKTVVEGRPKLESPYALNEVVIDNGPIARLIGINLRVNGEELVTYKADGLILATPTGSTAYSLAAGGPILHPAMEAIVVSPIAAFSLSTRPMVFHASDILELRIGSEHEVAGLTLDGQVSAPLLDTDRVIVTQADFRLKVVVFPEDSFYKVLKEKLHWGVSPFTH
ncbi:MAG: NAD(+)/NADH kinase [candidate division Zixibacteria bacterium]|nr:NAD(+)/NADH kinase [candidate division Zixibacteria bacterium]